MGKASKTLQNGGAKGSRTLISGLRNRCPAVERQPQARPLVRYNEASGVC